MAGLSLVEIKPHDKPNQCHRPLLARIVYAIAQNEIFKYSPVKSIALYTLPNLSIFVLEDEHSNSSPPLYKS